MVDVLIVLFAGQHMPLRPTDEGIQQIMKDFLEYKKEESQDPSKARPGYVVCDESCDKCLALIDFSKVLGMYIAKRRLIEGEEWKGESDVYEN